MKESLPIAYSTRQAEMKDVDLLLEFTRIEAEEAEARDLDLIQVRHAIEAAIQDPDYKAYYIVLIDEETHARGHCSFIKEWSDWNNAYYLWIQSIFIQQSARGTGGMPVLLDAVESLGRAWGSPEIRIYVHRQNHRAMHAWQREGFIDAGYWMAHRQIPTANKSDSKPKSLS